MRIRSCNVGPGAAIPVNGVGHAARDPMLERVDSLEEALAFVRVSNFAGAFARPAAKRILSARRPFSGSAVKRC